MFNEQEIISRASQGDLKAFALLVQQYEKLVFMVINRLVTGKEDCEDICQEVFMKVHKSLHTFRFESKFSTWIARIAWLTAINHLKKEKKHGFVRHPEDLEHFHFTHETPEVSLVRKDVSAYVNELIDQMPAPYKMVLTFYHLQEFSYQEITGITGLPEGTVKGWLFRARKLLKEKLNEHLQKEIL